MLPWSWLHGDLLFQERVWPWEGLCHQEGPRASDIFSGDCFEGLCLLKPVLSHLIEFESISLFQTKVLWKVLWYSYFIANKLFVTFVNIWIFQNLFRLLKNICWSENTQLHINKYCNFRRVSNKLRNLWPYLKVHFVFCKVVNPL